MRSTEMLAIAAALALLASTPLAQAQGTSGSTGAVASIPSNIGRVYSQQHSKS
jgi:predicted outer membrane protein